MYQCAISMTTGKNNEYQSSMHASTSLKVKNKHNLYTDNLMIFKKTWVGYYYLW